MTERERIGRVPFEAVELDQDFCAETYGESPCTASLDVGERECYNTRFTCQDPENYNLSTLTLHFCTDAQQIPQDGNYWFPFLQKVSISPGEINAGGGNRDLSALGKRSTITVRMSDRPHTDRIVDPYIDARKARIPTYDPMSRSTFWAKWRARNPYYLNRIIRYRSGYIRDGQIVDEVVRTFVITGFDGPDGQGNVVIKGKDILSLAVNRKAKCPNASRGKLKTALDENDTSAILTPQGIGDIDYPSDFYARINDEVMFCQRSGDDLTLTRAAYNTEAEEHDADDTVQLCVEFDAESADKILETLLKDYAGIPSENLATSEWEQERLNYLPRAYSALITEPTGVSTLAGELSEQAQFYAWFDERFDLVRMRSVRPADGEAIHDLEGDRHIIKGSVKIEDKTDQVLTRVIVNYGLRNPTLSLDEAKNFRSTEIIFSPNAETKEQHDGVRSHTVNCRWIPSLAAATAIDLGEKLITRYQEVPRAISFSMDAKDRDIWVGDFSRITTRLNVDDAGNQKPLNAQIIKATEAQQGTTFSYKAQEFVFVQPPRPNVRYVYLNTTTNVNLRDAHDDNYTSPLQDGDEVIFVVRDGAVIGGEPSTIEYLVNRDDRYLRPVIDQDVFSESLESNASPSGRSDYYLFFEMLRVPAPVAIETGSWPSDIDVKLKLIVESDAKVLGCGGFSGIHFALYSDTSGDNNTEWDDRHEMWLSDGGHALAISHDIEIENAGIIAGGGAGSAANPGIIDEVVDNDEFDYDPAEDYAFYQTLDYVVVPSGAGAGYQPGYRKEIFGRINLNITIKTQPGAGSEGSPGRGGKLTDYFTSFADIVYTKEGEGWTQELGSGNVLYSPDGAGLGQNGNKRPSYGVVEQINGRAGKAVAAGANLITWTNKGDVRGPEVN